MMPFYSNLPRIGLAVGLVCAGFFSFSTPVQAQTQTPEQLAQAQQSRDEFARRQFIDITTLLRSNPEEQTRQIEAAYELFAQIKETHSFIISSIIYLRAPLPANAAQLSPGELADFISKGIGSQYLSIEAKANGRELLRAHLQDIKLLIQSDLRSSDPAHVERGLATLCELNRREWGQNDAQQPSANPRLSAWLGDFRADVERIAQTDAVPTETTLQTLIALRDPNGIELLINKDPRNPTRYYREIRTLSQGDNKNPALLSLLPRLRSRDARQRYEALWALGDIDQALLTPSVGRLLNDSDAQVRFQAVATTFLLSAERFQLLRPRLLQALNDRDESVSWVAASGFVRRNDTVEAPTLLRLLKSQTTSLSIKAAVADDVRRLMGQTFNYSVDGSTVPQPHIVAMNQLAIEKFARWIRNPYAS